MQYCTLEFQLNIIVILVFFLKKKQQQFFATTLNRKNMKTHDPAFAVSIFPQYPLDNSCHIDRAVATIGAWGQLLPTNRLCPQGRSQTFGRGGGKGGAIENIFKNFEKILTKF